MPCKSVNILLERSQPKSVYVAKFSKTKSHDISSPSVVYPETGRTASVLIETSEKKHYRDGPTESGYLKTKHHNESRSFQSTANTVTVTVTVTVLPKKELGRLHSAAKIESMDDRIKAQRQRKEAVKGIEEEAEQQKEVFKKIDEPRLQEKEKYKRENQALKQDHYDERRVCLAKERLEQLRSKLNRVCEISIFFKKMFFEKEREAETRIQAHTKAEEELERKLEIVKNSIKENFQRRQQLLLELRKKPFEYNSKSEEKELVLQKQSIESDYRHKEKEDVIRKQEIEQNLHEKRLAQAQEVKCREVLKISRNQNGFSKIVQNLKREEAKQVNIQKECLKNNDRYRNGITQMDDKEFEERRKYERNRDQSEAIEWEEQENKRELNLRLVIQKKLSSMRDANLPDKYIKYVEQQICT